MDMDAGTIQASAAQPPGTGKHAGLAADTAIDIDDRQSFCHRHLPGFDKPVKPDIVYFTKD
jgi:hypothetical protein